MILSSCCFRVSVYLIPSSSSLTASISFRCTLTVSMARWRWDASSLSCCCTSLWGNFFIQPIPTYLHDTVSYRHFDRWLERLQRSTEALQLLLGQETLTFGHVSRWVVVISQYLPVSLQWGHWYWRFEHSFLRWWSRLWRKILTSLFSSVHSFGQQRRAYSHVVRWLSGNRNSPTQPHPFSLLLHITFDFLLTYGWRKSTETEISISGNMDQKRTLDTTHLQSKVIAIWGSQFVEQFWLKIETAKRQVFGLSKQHAKKRQPHASICH